MRQEHCAHIGHTHLIKEFLRCGGLPGRKVGVVAHAEPHQHRLILPTAARAAEVDVIQYVTVLPSRDLFSSSDPLHQRGFIWSKFL